MLAHTQLVPFLRKQIFRTPLAPALRWVLCDRLVRPIPRPACMPAVTLRERLAREFLTGSGLEIGALYYPLAVPRKARVKYVDRWDVEQLRHALQGDPVMKDAPMVNVDILDNGETLATLAPSSQDFIIANHFLEHTQDPIGTIRRHLQLLRSGGILYLAVPDKRWTFDVNRPVTPLAHLYRDHEEGPSWSFLDHVREFAELAEKKTGPELEARVQELQQQGTPSIHYHVWTQNDLAEMVVDVRRRLELPFNVEAVVANRPLGESILILRKV